MPAAAQLALAAWGLEGAATTPLSDGMHATFRVEAPQGGRFALRLYGDRTHALKAVRSEVAWLESLREVGLLVPEPVAARDGSLVVPVDGTGRLAVLTRWVDGEMLRGTPDAPAFLRLGDFMGRLHRHAERFTEPSGFVRPRYDLDRIVGRDGVVPPGPGGELFSDRDREVLDAAAALVRREIAPLGEGRAVFGLVHGDLQVTNYVFHQGQVGAIDFADFGWGYYLYDAAGLLLPLWEHRDFAELADAFARGYRQARPLPEAEWAALEAFLAARALYLLRWAAESWDRPAVQNGTATLVPHIKEQMARFVGRREPGRAVNRGQRPVMQLLGHLRERGVRIWEEGGQLSFKAPKGALTPELREEIAGRKAEVLAFLRRQVSPPQAGPPLAPVPRTGEIPVSFAQQRLWLLDRYEPGNPVYNIVQAVRLRGRLDEAALGKALGEVVRRHESLRTTFGEIEGRPVQVISPVADTALRVIDLLHLSEEEREAGAQLHADAEAVRPFNLERGPLARFILLRVGQEEALLVLNVHHIVSDGWSSGIMIRELLALYRAFSMGFPSPLRELPLQYVDFAVWQRLWLRGEILETQIAYWREQLKGMPDLLELPTDRSRPPVQTYRGEREPVAVPRAVSEALEGLGRQHNATPFMVLLAAFQLLLHRYTGRDDIPVGSPIANRNRAETEALIGFFVNTLVMRARLGSEPTFREFLDQVRQTTLDAYAHQDLPFEKLVDALRPERAASHIPLFQVMFALQNAPMPVLEITGLLLTYEEPRKATAKFDLALTLWQSAEGLQGNLTYNSDLFDGATARRIERHFVALLTEVALHPGRRAGEISYLTEMDRHQVLVAWNDTRTTSVDNRCVHELVEEVAACTPLAPAAVGNGEVWSYAVLEEQANRLAHYLRSQGVCPEQRVAVLLDRSPQEVMALLAVLKAGGAYLPVDPASPRDRLAFLLSDAGARVLLTSDRLTQDLPETNAVVVRLDGDAERIAACCGSTPQSGVGPGNLAYVIYTSGSTGVPKGVAIEHRGLTNLVNWHRRAFGVTAADQATRLSGLAFDASVWELWPYLAAGACIHIPPEEARMSPVALHNWLATQQITLAFVPTPAAEGLLSLDEPAPAALRFLLTGGDKLHLRPARGLSYTLINNYGPTESTVVATSGAVPMQGQVERSPAIGRPIDNLRIHMLDRYSAPVPVGVPGELCIGGEGLARGYLDRPGLTAERFIPDLFGGKPGARLYRTGDLARYLPDGEIEFLGRLDEQVKVRGFRIELGEVEAILLRHPMVREAAVVVEPGADGEGHLVGYLVQAASAPSVQDLQRFLRRLLPAYMVPAAFRLVEALPLGPTGKVNRRDLAAAGGLLVMQETVHVPPRTPLEQELAGLWTEILGVENPGVHDNFFELGGNSLMATRLVSRIRQAFGVELPLAAFFELPTLAGLAEAVEVARGAVESLSRDRQTAAADREEGEL